jgi:peptidoglycan/xylan/chitin deacetylase (PgdA/CDA1 family)
VNRLQDHFCHAQELLPPVAAGAPLIAEREQARPALKQSTFRGRPVYYHAAVDAGMAALQTDTGDTFDPNDAIACIQFEHYVQLDPPSHEKGLRSIYYRLKPVMPRSVQLTMQRVNARKRLRAVQFPGWPQDDTLRDLLSLFLAASMQKAQVERVPFIGFWPRGYTWACTLTHDVDTGFGYKNIFLMERIEAACDRASAWYIVPERYAWEQSVLDALKDKGHEIGVHGVNHDGQLFESREQFDWRRERINHYMAEWGACGFRSPATYRNPFWLPEIHAQYDSSYMDVATLEPQRGGVCAPFPFMLNDDFVELPITLPMDHTLINVLREDVFDSCRRKLHWIRAQHGLALALFHPDYNTRPHELDRYRRVVEEMGDDANAWFVLPQQVADWWQRRRRSRVVRKNDGFAIEGPAAVDGSIWWANLDGDTLTLEAARR